MSFKQIDSNVSRLTSLLVSSLVVAYLYLDEVFIIAFAIVDFIVRLFIKKDSSPLYMIALFLKESFKFKDKFVDSGAKRLAAMFGLAFMILLFATHFMHVWTLTLTIGLVYLSCALLDVFFNYCIGCKIYFVIKKIYPKFME